MFAASWRLFRLMGIPIKVDVSWLLIFALLTLSFAEDFPGVLRHNFPGNEPLSQADYWIMGAVTTLVFFICIVLHELGHALVARSRGLPIEGITLFLFGGVSELSEEPRSAATEFLMAIAGPLVSLVLGVCFWFAAGIGYQQNWPHPLVTVLGYLGMINIVVMVFNLVPAFPLDGGRVLRSILWRVTGNVQRATRWACAAGQAFACVLIALGILEFFYHQWVAGLLSVFVGIFLNGAAISSYQQILVRQALHGETVRHFMQPDPVVIPPSLDLLHWVEDYVYRYHYRVFPVASNGRLEGLITTDALRKIPRAEWAAHTVNEAMIADFGAVSIAADADAMDALAKMRRTGASRLLITDGDRLVGVVSQRDLLNFLNLKLDLGSNHDNNGVPG